MRSEFLDLGGPVHFVDFGGEGRPIVLVHGLGGSHANWLSVGPRLARLGRTVALDLAGFGRTPPAGRRATVTANRALLESFVDALGLGRATFVGNSMGGLISILHALSRPDQVERLVLVAPALPRPDNAPIDRTTLALFAGYMVPGLGEYVLASREGKLGPEGTVRETLRYCGLRQEKVPPEVFEAHVELTRERWLYSWNRSAFLEAARSIVPLVLQRRRYFGMVSRVEAPTLLIQGARDRLVAKASARELAASRPDWAYEELDGVGHVPQLEVPDRFCEVVERWLGAVPARPREDDDGKRSAS